MISRRAYEADMISRKLLKTEIDKVRSEHLELLYGIIKLLENGTHEGGASPLAEAQATETGVPLDWHEFVANTYGCLSDAPISRGDQGHYESREVME
jgi:hypothetical protein